MVNDRFVLDKGVYRRERSPQVPESSEWVVVDASGKTLGRLASQVAAILLGKHKPTFAPHRKMGDEVVVVNAAKIVVTGRKRDQKLYRHHSGYPGGLKTKTFRDVFQKNPAEVVLRAVHGMLPHTRLGDALRARVRVYAGPEHPHVAQKPRVITLAP